MGLLVFMCPFFVLGAIAQMWLRSTFQRWAQVGTARGVSGAQVASAILRRNDVTDVAVEASGGGALSDHYDPRSRIIRLSPEVYSGRSIAAAAVAAHETGHALQHATRYAALGLRSAAVPAAISADKVTFILILIGGMLWRGGGNAGPWFLAAGVIYSAAVVLSIITLPVEFNASRRALAQLRDGGIVTVPEADAARGVLTAAASTYVVAAIASIATMAYYLLLASAARRQ